jgi:hypothetical protein
VVSTPGILIFKISQKQVVDFGKSIFSNSHFENCQVKADRLVTVLGILTISQVAGAGNRRRVEG